MFQFEVSQRTWHCRVTGGFASQLIASAMPLVTGPQAVVCADLAASASVSCEAVAQLRTPLNSTQTEHSTFWPERVDQVRKAMKATIRAIQPRVLELIPVI